MNFITIIGIVASLFTALSLLPQLVKVIKEKKAEDISYSMLIILFAGLALWIYYGILKEDLILIAANSISIVINATLTFFAFKYKEGK